MLHHPRFRAAYDLFILRAKTETKLQPISDWWTEIQEVSLKQRKIMIDDITMKNDSEYVNSCTEEQLSFDF